jgi:hypothetical protein
MVIVEANSLQKESHEAEETCQTSTGTGSSARSTASEDRSDAGGCSGSGAAGGGLDDRGGVGVHWRDRGGGRGAVVAVGDGRGHQRAGNGVRTAAHGEAGGLGDNVSLTAVGEGGSLRAVGGVRGNNLGDSRLGGGTSGEGSKSCNGETHFGLDRVDY